MDELKTLRELAKGNGQISAAVAAEVKRGELMGYYVQRRESTNTVYTIPTSRCPLMNGQQSTVWAPHPGRSIDEVCIHVRERTSWGSTKDAAPSPSL